MRDHAEDYIRGPEKPLRNNVKMVLKLLILGFVSAAVTDLLRTHTPVQGRMAELVGLLSGILSQQAIAPRLTAAKLSLAIVGTCAVMGVLFFLHW
jgi:hypothetical protein